MQTFQTYLQGEGIILWSIYDTVTSVSDNI